MLNDYVQVVLSLRQLLCLPSTALAALVEHEAAHHHSSVAEQLRELSDKTAPLEADRVKHQQHLRPVLAQPACRADLEAIQQAEDARWCSEVASWASLVQGARVSVPQAASLSKQRLLAATRQLGELLAKFPMPEDLVPAPPGDTSFYGIPALNIMQLERWELAMAETPDAPVSSDTGRPFAVATVALPKPDMSAEELGWSLASTTDLEDALRGVATLTGDADAQAAVQIASTSVPATGNSTASHGRAEGGKGAAGTRAAACTTSMSHQETGTSTGSEIVCCIDTPLFRALLRAHRAAATNMDLECTNDMNAMLLGPLERIRRAQSWRNTWNLMLLHLGPSAINS
jgi:hypothetical protein